MLPYHVTTQPRFVDCRLMWKVSLELSCMLQFHRSDAIGGSEGTANRTYGSPEPTPHRDFYRTVATGGVEDGDGLAGRLPGGDRFLPERVALNTATGPERASSRRRKPEVSRPCETHRNRTYTKLVTNSWNISSRRASLGADRVPESQAAGGRVGGRTSQSHQLAAVVVLPQGALALTSRP